MKKVFYIASVLLASAMITMYSCTKEEEAAKSDDCSTCKDGLVLAEKINSFKAQLLKAKDNPKDGEVMTKEEAKDNMQLLFNASHGFPIDTYTQITVDTVEFILPTDADGNVLMTDILAKYNEMKGLVKGVYDNNTFSEKHLISLSLKMTEDDGTTKIDAVSTIGGKGEKDLGNFNKCWIYGENQGFCDGSNYVWEMDGGDTLANFLFSRRPFPLFCPEGYHSIGVVDYIETFTGKEGVGAGSIFYLEKPKIEQFTEEEKELQASEMNSWYDLEYEFLFTELTENKPNNWVLTSLKIDAKEKFYTNSNNVQMRFINHPNDVEYSYIYCVEDEVIDPPVDL